MIILLDILYFIIFSKNHVLLLFFSIILIDTVDYEILSIIFFEDKKYLIDRKLIKDIVEKVDNITTRSKIDFYSIYNPLRIALELETNSDTFNIHVNEIKSIQINNSEYTTIFKT